MNIQVEGGPPGARSKMYKVIMPVEHKDGSKHWMRIGSGFPNRDASINLYLDALPAGNHNMIQMREMTDEDFSRRKPGMGEHGPLPPPISPRGATDDLPF